MSIGDAGHSACCPERAALLSRFYEGRIDLLRADFRGQDPSFASECEAAIGDVWRRISIAIEERNNALSRASACHHGDEECALLRFASVCDQELLASAHPPQSDEDLARRMGRWQQELDVLEALHTEVAETTESANDVYAAQEKCHLAFKHFLEGFRQPSPPVVCAKHVQHPRGRPVDTLQPMLFRPEEIARARGACHTLWVVGRELRAQLHHIQTATAPLISDIMGIIEESSSNLAQEYAQATPERKKQIAIQLATIQDVLQKNASMFQEMIQQEAIRMQNLSLLAEQLNPEALLAIAGEKELVCQQVIAESQENIQAVVEKYGFDPSKEGL